MLKQEEESLNLDDRNDIENSNNSSLRNTELPPYDSKRTLWDRIPKYKWWVTPLNIFFICFFLIIIDVVTPPNTAWFNIDWAWWPVAGLAFAYIVSFIVFKRPAIAWIIGPILMLGTSILLITIDLMLPRNENVLKLDWAIIPASALIIFGVLIPIITKFGRKKEKPIEKFRKALIEMDKPKSQKSLRELD